MMKGSQNSIYFANNYGKDSLWLLAFASLVCVFVIEKLNWLSGSYM